MRNEPNDLRKNIEIIKVARIYYVLTPETQILVRFALWPVFYENEVVENRHKKIEKAPNDLKMTLNSHN